MAVVLFAGTFRGSGELQETSGRTCGQRCTWPLRVIILLCSSWVRNKMCLSLLLFTQKNKNENKKSVEDLSSLYQVLRLVLMF